MNREDLEHYYGGIVRRLAIAMSPYQTEDAWDKAGYRSRCKWLDQASKCILHLMADQDFERLIMDLAISGVKETLAGCVVTKQTDK